MIKVSDYVMRRLADSGVTQAFMVTGGGAMHLNDSLVREKRLHYVCNHHEQAAAMAAEAYARVAGGPALVSVTTGPGAINALNGTDVEGRTLTVNEARPKTEKTREDRPGGSGFRRRRW